jgi:CRP-like cAMP-binding protein
MARDDTAAPSPRRRRRLESHEFDPSFTERVDVLSSLDLCKAWSDQRLMIVGYYARFFRFPRGHVILSFRQHLADVFFLKAGEADAFQTSAILRKTLTDPSAIVRIKRFQLFGALGDSSQFDDGSSMFSVAAASDVVVVAIPADEFFAQLAEDERAALAAENVFVRHVRAVAAQQRGHGSGVGLFLEEAERAEEVVGDKGGVLFSTRVARSAKEEVLEERGEGEDEGGGLFIDLSAVMNSRAFLSHFVPPPQKDKTWRMMPIAPRLVPLGASHTPPPAAAPALANAPSPFSRSPSPLPPLISNPPSRRAVHPPSIAPHLRVNAGALRGVGVFDSGAPEGGSEDNAAALASVERAVASAAPMGSKRSEVKVWDARGRPQGRVSPPRGGGGFETEGEEGAGSDEGGGIPLLLDATSSKQTAAVMGDSR